MLIHLAELIAGVDDENLRAERDAMDAMIDGFADRPLGHENPHLIALAERAAALSDERKRQDSEQARTEVARSLAQLD